MAKDGSGIEKRLEAVMPKEATLKGDAPIDDDTIGDVLPVGPRRRVSEMQAKLVSHTDDEYLTVAQAAHAAGPTTTGYVADAALTAATSREPPGDAPWRSALLELMDTRNQIRRIGTNINQATRILNTTGESPVWLERAVAMTERSLTKVDDATEAVASLTLRNGRAPHH